MIRNPFALVSVKPVVIRLEYVVSCSVPEDDAAEWKDDETYDEGDEVIWDHVIYQSLISGNDGIAPGTDPAKWKSRGATNRWRMFDRVIGTQTKSTEPIVVELELKQAVSAVAALNITGGVHVQLEIERGDATVYSKSISLRRRPLYPSAWAWCFGERRTPTQAIFLDVPGIRGSKIRLTITGGENLGVGLVAAGVVRRFGIGIKSGARISMNDNSRKEADEYGYLTIVERPLTRRNSYSVLIESNEVDLVEAYLREVHATGCLWLAPGGESRTIYGLCNNFDILLDDGVYADCDIELESFV